MNIELGCPGWETSDSRPKLQTPQLLPGGRWIIAFVTSPDLYSDHVFCWDIDSPENYFNGAKHILTPVASIVLSERDIPSSRVRFETLPYNMASHSFLIAISTAVDREISLDILELQCHQNGRPYFSFISSFRSSLDKRPHFSFAQGWALCEEDEAFSLWNLQSDEITNAPDSLVVGRSVSKHMVTPDGTIVKIAPSWREAALVISFVSIREHHGQWRHMESPIFQPHISLYSGVASHPSTHAEQPTTLEDVELETLTTLPNGDTIVALSVENFDPVVRFRGVFAITPNGDYEYLHSEPSWRMLCSDEQLMCLWGKRNWDYVHYFSPHLPPSTPFLQPAKPTSSRPSENWIITLSPKQGEADIVAFPAQEGDDIGYFNNCLGACLRSGTWLYELRQPYRQSLVVVRFD
ncbi:hypothetical protein DL93DRAFT_2169424 [Clavulina sp. PMI_390]|nr:hypothetical protein DL93DRAFT_2169424 [Clavulina sp. PMI_390]